MTSHQHCGTRIKRLLKQYQADFKKDEHVQQNIQLGIWSWELIQRSQAQAPSSPEDTCVGAEAHMCPMM